MSTEPVIVYEEPIADAIRCGDTIYVAGHASYDEDGSVFAPGDLVRQTERTFENMRATLAREGATLADVVKLVNYFAVPLTREVAEAYWDVRKRYFGDDHKLASTGVQVAGLLDEGLVIEMDAIAVIRRASPNVEHDAG